MTEEKRVSIPDRWQEDYVGLIELSNSLPEYDCMQTDIATQKKLIEQLGTAEAERDQLKAELAEMQWKPITPDSMPKVGDEVMGYDPAEAMLHIHIRSVSRGLAEARNRNPQDRDWERLGYTHYRAINPPKP